MYGAFIASMENISAGKRIRVCCEKGKPAVRRGRKAHGASYVWEVAGLSNSGGGATRLGP